MGQEGAYKEDERVALKTNWRQGRVQRIWVRVVDCRRVKVRTQHRGWQSNLFPGNQDMCWGCRGEEVCRTGKYRWFGGEQKKEFSSKVVNVEGELEKALLKSESLMTTLIL